MPDLSIRDAVLQMREVDALVDFGRALERWAFSLGFSEHSPVEAVFDDLAPQSVPSDRGPVTIREAVQAMLLVPALEQLGATIDRWTYRFGVDQMSRYADRSW